MESLRDLIARAEAAGHSDGTLAALRAQAEKAEAQRADACEKARNPFCGVPGMPAIADLPFVVAPAGSPVHLRGPPNDKNFAWTHGTFPDPATTHGTRTGWQASPAKPTKALMSKLTEMYQERVANAKDSEGNAYDPTIAQTMHNAERRAYEAKKKQMYAIGPAAWPPRPVPDRPENVKHGYHYRCHDGQHVHIIEPMLPGSEPPTWICLFVDAAGHTQVHSKQLVKLNELECEAMGRPGVDAMEAGILAARQAGNDARQAKAAGGSGRGKKRER